jgi:D-glycero-alpha-D-manno-heptose-7-phosphate kinase
MRHARAAAPVRLDLAGGWTDVPPFSAREGGVVVSAAIGLTAEAEVLPGGDGLTLIAEDLGETLHVEGPDALGRTAGLALHRAALRLARPDCGLCLRTHCTAPAGSGLGSSGALDVALVAALAAARGERPDARAVADAACRLEAVEAGIPGGRQDQFTAAYGGFLLLRFCDPDAEVTRLCLDEGFAEELARRMVLCYTGASRFSGATIARVMEAYERGDRLVVGALRRIREIAVEMADALAAADPVRIGALLAENWRQQQALDPGMRTPEMARLEAALADAGALGGKAAGSGAGGCMFFVAGDDVAAARRAAVAAGARLLPVVWAAEGVRTW